MMALAAATGRAEDIADYPDHVKDEIRAAQLERETRLIKLQHELQNLQDSVLAAQAQKLKAVLELLKTEREIRAMLKRYPELSPLYESVLGNDSSLAPHNTARGEMNFCRCLDAAQVLWLGRQEQSGEAVLSLDNVLYNVWVGGQLGGTLCTLSDVNENRAVLQCRDPAQDEVRVRSIAMKRFYRIEGSEPEADTPSP